MDEERDARLHGTTLAERIRKCEANLVRHFRRLDEKVDAILHRLGVVLILERMNMASLADLEVQVKATTDLEASAVTLIRGIAQQLADAIASGDPTKIQELSDSLATSATSLASAISENTSQP